MRKWINNKKGTISILIALSMVVLLGFAAISIDVGWTLFHKSRLQNATDAAALAGAKMLFLGEELESAREGAMNYLICNEFGSDYHVDNCNIKVISTSDKDKNVNISEVNSDKDSLIVKTIFYKNKGEYNKISVEATEYVDYFFAKIFDENGGNITVKSAAEVGEVFKGLNGLRPFGVVDDEWDEFETVILKTDSEKNGSNESIRGNFQALALDGRGSEYGECILKGNIKGYRIGDDVWTETGNIVGPTHKNITDLIKPCVNGHKKPTCIAQSYRAKCPRVILVPLIDSLVDAHGRDTVEIVGFALFFINDVSKEEEMTDNGKVKYTKVTGTFIKKLTDSEIEDLEGKAKALGVRLVSAINYTGEETE